MKKTYGLYSSLSIVIANMIGTGIFTSLGFQVLELQSGFALLTLWVIGGITALAGAMVYAELGARMPRSGGEYHFLSRIYHPSLGFVSGWISFIVGFTAATAAAAIALGTYFSAALKLEGSFLGMGTETIIAILVILLLSILHARLKMAGARFQNLFTSLKVLTLLAMILIGFRAGSSTDVIFRPSGSSLNEIVSPAFAVSLFFVSFAYSGWNAAAYIAGEIRDPARNIPLSLIPGTLVVTMLYLGITWVFLKIIPIEGMQGKIEIGYLYGQRILGDQAGSIMGMLFGFLLFSTVSSLIITGPRVSQVMGEDYKGIRWFAASSRQDTPARAIYIQGLIAVIYLLTSTFEQMITYIGFTLNLMTLLTVLGMMILRKRKPVVRDEMYRIRLYPHVPIVFLLINSWIMIYGFIYRPIESLAGVLTAGAGMILWIILRGGSVQSPEGS